jgi:plasmid stability protein
MHVVHPQNGPGEGAPPVAPAAPAEDAAPEELTRFVSFRLTDSDRARFRMVAARHDRTMSGHLQHLVREAIADEPHPAAPPAA